MSEGFSGRGGQGQNFTGEILLRSLFSSGSSAALRRFVEERRASPGISSWLQLPQLSRAVRAQQQEHWVRRSDHLQISLSGCRCGPGTGCPSPLSFVL